jgi:hypothetical protein
VFVLFQGCKVARCTAINKIDILYDFIEKLYDTFIVYNEACLTSSLADLLRSLKDDS